LSVEVIVGTLGRAHGLLGELFVDVTTDLPDERFRPGARLRAVAGTVPSSGQSPGRVLTVASFRAGQPRSLVRFTEATDRQAAEALTGQTLVADVDPRDAAGDADEYFDHQLIGLRLVTVDGQAVGRIVAVDHAGYQDALVAELDADASRRTIPFVNALVPTVDLAAGQVVVDPIPGLLDDEDRS